MTSSTSPAPDPTTPRPTNDAERIHERVVGLRQVFASGRTRPLAWRRDQLLGLERMLRSHGDELAQALQADLRKPGVEAWMADVGSVLADARLVRRKLRRWLRPERIAVPLSQRPGRARIVREPLGVVLVIAPWNYPVQLSLVPLVGALAAGNCVVLKPSEVTAHTSAALARLLPRYVDPEAVAVVEGGVSETTTLLAERFDHIFYTGNSRVARIVMAAAARNLTPVTLELGGKSPCLVDADVDLDVAVRRIAWGKFLNAGQTCIAPDYVLVHASREQELLQGLTRTIGEFYGEDPRASTDYARIVSDAHFERVTKLLESGEVVAGGQVDAAQRYVAPTLLRGVSEQSPAMQEEIFGPILPVLPVPDMQTAIDFVKRREKPLALYLFTRNAELEEKVVRETSSGGVCVNATLWHLANPALPFGGVGESGMGAYHGRYTFEAFSHRKSVLTKPTRPEARFPYPPYSRWKLALLKRLL